MPAEATDPAAKSVPGRRGAFLWVLAALMLAHAGLLLSGIRSNFVVLDEVGHVPAGVSHWLTGNFALYRVNPPLGRMLAALPALIARPLVDYARLDPRPGHRSDWDVGRDFAELNRQRYFDIICLARLAGVAWSLLGMLLVFLWGRDLYGNPAGCFGAALWCFDPTVLAFSQVVTPDIPAAVAGLGATYAFWRSLRRPSWAGTTLAGLLLGIAQLTKFTMLVLYVVWPLQWLAVRRPWRDPVKSRGFGVKQILKGFSIFVISIYVINFGYFYKGSFRPLGKFRFASRVLRGDAPGGGSVQLGNRFRGTWLGSIPVPVPAEYLQGIDAQRLDFESKFPSYLAGKWMDRGWWYYYLYALAVKEPIGTLALASWGLALTVSRRHRVGKAGAGTAALWLPSAVVVAFVSSQTGFNHHMRYILPAFPFAAVATGGLAHLVREGRRFARLLVYGLFAWSVVSVLAIHPHFMSYFNEAAGGPERGAEHLLDSNIDWGQDLLHLARWLEAHPEARPLGLAYFHFLDPRIIGIDFRIPPPGAPTSPGEEGGEPRAEFGPSPGYYAISVNYLHGMMFSAADGEGGWRAVDRHDYFTYFRRFRPIGRAGYSIYIYRITPEGAAAERRRVVVPPPPDGSQHAAWPG